MGAKISLIGNIYGRLTVISQSDLRYKDNKIKYNCQCICGNEIIVGAANLKKGNVKSCGCILKEFHNYKFNNNINIYNKKFGMLLVIEKSFIGKNKFWKCLCDCGNYSNVLENSLRMGYTKSCGCIVKENININNQSLKKHLHTSNRSKTPEYATWCNMKKRCFDEKNNYYKYYGGKGITVCDRWVHSFENFYADMGKRPINKQSIDRIDFNGNYEPSNCRWATIHEQNINRSHVIFYTYNGITLCKKDWSIELGVSYYIFNKTLKKLNDFESTYNYLMKLKTLVC